MKQYFESQIAKSNPLTSEKLGQMKEARIKARTDNNKPVIESEVTPKSMYNSPFVEGDVVLYFTEWIKVDNGINQQINSVTLRELDQLAEDFDFLEIRKEIPSLKRKGTMEGIEKVLNT